MTQSITIELATVIGVSLGLTVVGFLAGYVVGHMGGLRDQQPIIDCLNRELTKYSEQSKHGDKRERRAIAESISKLCDRHNLPIQEALNAEQKT